MRDVELRVPTATILKLLTATLLTFLLVKLWPLIMLLVLGALLAVTLYPVVRLQMRRGIPRPLALLLVTLALLGVVVAASVTLVPTLVEQISGLLKDLPKYRDQLLALLPHNSFFTSIAKRGLGRTGLPSPASMVRPLVTVGGLALGGIAQLAVVLVLAVYLMIDGPRAWAWLLAFFKPINRAKLERTGYEATKIVFAYMTGQLITSVLCGAFAFTVLLVMNVPAALTLGVLAAIFDILPILGFFLFTIPAALLALTVSAKAAVIVACSYAVYHGVENYLIVPKIYGNRLRVSTLAVLVALLAASSAAGILGAIAVLPVVAAYPVVERIWLVRYLGREVVNEHKKQLEESEGKKSA